jgi:hypothetical protein
MLEDMYFYTPSTNTAEAYEFDPDLFLNGYWYFASMQCRQLGYPSGSVSQWYFWDENYSSTVVSGQTVYSGAWVLQPGFTYPCSLSTNAMHHFQLYTTYNTSNQTYTYNTFVVDGTVVYQNLGLSYPAQPGHSGGNNINIEHQIDNSASTSTSNTVYYDNYNLWVW